MKRVVVITREPEEHFHTIDEYELLLEAMRVFDQLQAEMIMVNLLGDK